MRRRLFNLLAALSLLAGLAVAGVWVRSYSKQEWVGWRGSVRWVGVVWQRGILQLEIFESHEGLWEREGFAFINDYNVDPWVPRGWDLHPGFMFHSRDAEFYQQTFVRTRLWLPFLLSLVMPAAWFVNRRGFRRPQDGHCPQCGYDLQGLPGPRPRCPECGMENPLREESGEKSGADRALGIRH